MPGKKRSLTRALSELEHEVDIDDAFRRVFTEEPSDAQIIDEFEITPDTIKEDRRACKHCGQPIRFRTYGTLEEHTAPCGRRCLGGGVPVGEHFHDRECVLCIFEGGISALRRAR